MLDGQKSTIQNFRIQKTERFDIDSYGDKLEITPGEMTFNLQDKDMVDVIIDYSEFYIHFWSDYYYYGNGFVLRWECASSSGELSNEGRIAIGAVVGAIIFAIVLYFKIKGRQNTRVVRSVVTRSRPAAAAAVVRIPPPEQTAPASEVTPSAPAYFIRETTLPTASNFVAMAWGNDNIPVAGTIPDIAPPTYDDALKSNY